MAPSFDCVGSNLLCAEDNNNIFNDNDYCFGGDTENHRYYRNLNQNRIFNNVDEDGLALLSEECVGLMVEKENHHLPNADYLKRLKTGDLDLEARKQAVDWIGKVHSQFSFGPLCAYLSVNYLDRFLSAYELPKGKAWMMQLLAVACVSLAAKMEETEVPFILDLQVGEYSKFLFEARTIQRMELLVLSTLNWRMQAITPFSFIDYFLYKLNDDKIPLRSSILRSVELISSTIKAGIDFLECKPSEIAAAVATYVAAETKTMDSERAISVLTHHVQKERVMKCVEMVHDLSLVGGCVKAGNGNGNGNGNAAVSSVPQSPIGVLDAAACLSYKTKSGDETTAGSCANSSHCSPTTKRRKLNTNRPCQVEL